MPGDSTFVVAICTYRRPQGLENLLLALAPQANTHGVEVIVIDNDPDQSAVPVVTAQSASFTMGLRYTVAQPKGLVVARNTALDYAAQQGVGVLFIDDDEVPFPHWVESMKKMTELHPIDVLAGPVIPELEQEAPPWSPDARHWTRPTFDDGLIVKVSVPDANMLIPSRVILDGFRYDMSFNSSGGQDFDLLTRLRMTGYVVRWVSAGAVNEFIPAGRISVDYIATRYYFDSISYLRTARRRGEVAPVSCLRLLKNVLVGIALSSVGAVARSKEASAEGRFALSRARGTFHGLLGRDFDRWEGYQFDTGRSR